MLPPETTSKRAESWWRWFRKSLWRHWAGRIWGHFKMIWGQFVNRNSKLLQASHVTTQNDRKRSRNPMEMVSDVTFQTFRPISVIWGPFRPFLANFGLKLKMVVNWSCDHSKWPQEKQKSNGYGLRFHFSDIWVNFGHLGPFLATFGQFGPKS